MLPLNLFSPPLASDKKTSQAALIHKFSTKEFRLTCGFATLIRQRIGLLSLGRSIILFTNIDKLRIKVLEMVQVINRKYMAKSVYVILGLTILAAVALSVLLHPTSSALAQTPTSTACSANGSVSDSANGGVIFTITTTGKCESAPLQLVGVSKTGVKSVLSSQNLTQQSNGNQLGSVNFIPTSAYSFYQVVIPNVFSANIQS